MPIADYLGAIGLTILIEGIVLFGLVRPRGPHLLLAAIAINLVTVPLANLAYWFAVPRLDGASAFILVELGVVLGEMPLIRLLVGSSWRGSVALSVATNTASILCGLALYTH